MKTIGITFALTICLTAACLAPGYEEELQEAELAHLDEEQVSGKATTGLVLPAQTVEQWRLFLASNDTSRVRSLEDWNRCLLDSTCNPLGGVDPDIVDAFTRSLIFNNGGLAGARYDMVKPLLTSVEFVSLWDKFGIGDLLLSYSIDFICINCTCVPQVGGICTDYGC